MSLNNKNQLKEVQVWEAWIRVVMGLEDSLEYMADMVEFLKTQDHCIGFCSLLQSNPEFNMANDINGQCDELCPYGKHFGACNGPVSIYGSIIDAIVDAQGLLTSLAVESFKLLAQAGELALTAIEMYEAEEDVCDGNCAECVQNAFKVDSGAVPFLLKLISMPDDGLEKAAKKAKGDFMPTQKSIFSPDFFKGVAPGTDPHADYWNQLAELTEHFSDILFPKDR